MHMGGVLSAECLQLDSWFLCVAIASDPTAQFL